MRNPPLVVWPLVLVGLVVIAWTVGSVVRFLFPETGDASETIGVLVAIATFIILGLKSRRGSY